MKLLKKAIKTKFNLFLIMAYVKRSFGDYIVKLMYKYGFYVEKVTSADSFHSKLTKGGTVLKEDELRKITAFLRRTNDLNLYDQILRQFFPLWICFLEMLSLFINCPLSIHKNTFVLII